MGVFVVVVCLFVFGFGLFVFLRKDQPSVVLSHSSDEQLLYLDVQCMFTLDLICMQYLCVSVIHQTVMDYRIFNVPTRSYMFVVIDSVRLNGCLFHFHGMGRGRNLEPPFIFRSGGSLGPLYEVLEAALQMCATFRRHLSSSDNRILRVPSIKTIFFVQRSILCAGPMIRKKLPYNQVFTIKILIQSKHQSVWHALLNFEVFNPICHIPVEACVACTVTVFS